MFSRKNIILAISAGIAAYKSIELVRVFIKNEFNVRVIMTKNAVEFVTPLTLQALSGNRVRVDLFDPEAEAGMDHIALGRWADLLIVAPASADIIARFSCGLANDLVSTVFLATTAAKIIVPAMNVHMWENSITKENIKRLQAHGVTVLPPETGALACGDYGAGRMMSVERIYAHTLTFFRLAKLTGMKLLINAGPTQEAIDSVRYVSNRSSGKMGYALAEAAYQMGADVTLISGPVNLTRPPNITFHAVKSAQDMFIKVMQEVPSNDVFIAAAAVADYQCIKPAQRKIKKDKMGDELTLRLTKTVDILASVAKLDSPPFLLGFAAETDDLEKYAKSKLETKKVDMIAANWVSNSQGFDLDENEIVLYWKHGKKDLGHASKKLLAFKLLNAMKDYMDGINTDKTS